VLTSTCSPKNPEHLHLPTCPSYTALMQHEAVKSTVSQIWRRQAIPALQEYVSIPALSPAFDAAWESHGHIDRAVGLLTDWARQLGLRGARVSTRSVPGLTPIIVVEIDSTIERSTNGPHLAHEYSTEPPTTSTVLMYGHLDKQPEMEGWFDGLTAWTPVITDDKLYGRGGADDGYALFASLTAVQSLQSSGTPHGRIVLLIEGSEESGSSDLEHHVTALAPTIGDVDLVICLDSGCATYDRLWTTTSLRGLAAIRFTVRVLTEGVHSGGAGGVVPSSFRIARLLLDRLEDPLTGDLRLPELNVTIPPAVTSAATDTASLLGADWAERSYPWVSSTCGHHINDDGTTAEHLLDRTWRAAFEVVGADGLPSTAKAGNVLRPQTTLSLAMRLPPTTDPVIAVAAVKRALTTDIPYGASVEVDTDSAAGWAAPALADWLANTLEDASMAAYGKSHRSMGEGGTIPFMAMLAKRFPDAQFAVAGVLGPGSNAHGPNEFLHLGYAEQLTVAVAHIVASHAQHGVAAAEN
jgi:acetylornithine deacetylase/succinyl-diaminopimelate desuccinylase-like protein